MTSNVVYLGRQIPDYTGNKDAAMDLANRFRQFYKDRGHHVDVEVESIPVYNSQGDRVFTRYQLKHNVSFSIKDLSASRFLART